MKLIGLTGSIASGKSVASDYLNKKGYFIIDSDKIAHNITKKGNEGLNAIVKKFGYDILDKQGNLNRKKLSDIVFSDKEKLKLLNETLHPIIFKSIDEKINQLKNQKIVFLDAPLLFETKLDKKCDFVLLITTDEKTQIKRIMQRDFVDENKAKSVIANQMSTDEKQKRSDYIIDNSSTIDFLYQKIDEFLLYLEKENL